MPPNTTGNNSHSHEHEKLRSSIPTWELISSCDWYSVVRVDLTLSSIAIFYNIIIALLPFFVSRMYCTQGVVISSYTCGASLVSIYCALLDLRLMESSKQQLENEEYATYLLIWFLCYHCIFHIQLLSWNQHHSVTHFYAHRRFTSRSKLIKITLVVWISAAVFPLLEIFFLFNPFDYPNTPPASEFRLIIMLISMGCIFFGPLVLTMTWNTKIFSFLLKVMHNGFVKETPPQSSERNNPDVNPRFISEPWNRIKEEIYEDPPEYATLPDNVTVQLTNSFVNVVMVTTFGSIMIPWISYHVLCIFRTAEVLNNYQFYEIIYGCELYVSLYTAVKFLLLLNPFWCFYYRKEIYIMCRVRERHGVTRE